MTWDCSCKNGLGQKCKAMVWACRRKNGLGQKGKMMFTKMFEEDHKKILRKLQLFADGGGEPGGGSDPGDPVDPPGGGDDPKPLSFDDFLKQKGNQAEFDKRVNKAIETAVGKAREQWELETNDKLSEAEKLARMTKEQKAEYRQKQLENELNALKKEKAMNEMAATARKMLADEKITVPDTLLAYIIAEDAEKTKAAVEDFVKLFNDAVGEELKKSARQETPREGSRSAGESEKMDIAKMAKDARIIK